MPPLQAPTPHKRGPTLLPPLSTGCSGAPPHAQQGSSCCLLVAQSQRRGWLGAVVATTTSGSSSWSTHVVLSLPRALSSSTHPALVLG